MEHPRSPRRQATARGLALLGCCIAVGWLPVLIGRSVVPDAAALFPLAQLRQPYFIPEHALLLYLRAPLVIGSACVLFLSPGLYLALVLRGANTAGQWILSALGLSLVVVSTSTAVLQWIIGTPLRGTSFAATVGGCSLACLALGFIALRRGHRVTWPLASPHAGVTLLACAIGPMVISAALTPKLFWEVFTGDGAHAFESARLLVVQPVPFWPPAAGQIASYPGVTTMLSTYPAAWFVRLFGELEVSARLPMILYLAALYAGICALIEQGRPAQVGVAERCLFWLGLATYTVVVSFSATYNPYHADVALPCAQVTLLIACFLATALAFVRRQRAWLILFATLTCVTSPAGMQLLLFWSVAALVAWRPAPWREIGLLCATIAACMIAGALLPALLGAVGLPAPGGEHGFWGLMERMNFLQLSNVSRFIYLIVPSGILPALALFVWPRDDIIGRALIVTTWLYFGFYYLLAHTPLHYFGPAMILPVVVFWRSRILQVPRYRPWALVGAAAGALIGLRLSVPADVSPHTTARVLGASIVDRLDGYESLDPSAYRRQKLLLQLFPSVGDPRVPDQLYGGAANSWYYYARHPRTHDGEMNYVLQALTDPAPGTMRLVAQDDGVALYVRDDAVWRQHQTLHPPSSLASLYTLPRWTFQRGMTPTDGTRIINVFELLPASLRRFVFEALPTRVQEKAKRRGFD